ncbi:hypothetical protein [Galbitalea soli]|uniref:DUF4212 domain-containing protein n=1 Tax=Galbitalea soli TaxID=1268042 RepID=A0A7C9TRV4_9MICO|nr:hypothetical protein [Galbitalea soli]NEM92497.1 hypothetical protein [Galbitalea soli]NYJ29534.1 hypothetical protein [Galbitalea soli]
MTDSHERGGVRADLVFYLFRPWWRTVWLVAAVAWSVTLNVLYISGSAHTEGIGVASVIPIWAYTFGVAARRWRTRPGAPQRR